MQGTLHENAEPGPSHEKTKKATRLKSAGVALLEDFHSHNPQRNPTKAERIALLEKVHAIPGCEEYAERNLILWFKRRRQPLSGPPLPTKCFPTLIPQAEQHLEVLWKATKNPSHDVIQTWAILLKAAAGDIAGWLDEKNRGAHDKAQQRLPTPSDSTSPEPSMISPTSMTSPTSPYQGQFFNFKVDPSRSPNNPIARTSPEIPHHRYKTIPPQPSLQSRLLRGIAEATTMPPTSAATPATADEFNAMFDPYREKMESILHRLK